jgi:hypothetical protein
MPLESVGRLPGKKDINNQFSRENIKTTLEHYNSIKNKGDGDYTFGALTDKWYQAGNQWMSDVKLYPQPIRDQIKQYIIEALTNETDGNPDPIPFTLKWSPGEEKKVNRTYDPYTIEVVGCLEPPGSSLYERKK